MASLGNETLAPASEMQLTQYSIQGTSFSMHRDFGTLEDPSNKRRRTGESTENPDLPGVASAMDTDDVRTFRATTSTSSTSSASATNAATDGPFNADLGDETLFKKFLKEAFCVFINKKVLLYGSDRNDLYLRQVAVRTFHTHATKNTLPKDLCFNFQAGNPYKKSVPNRDSLLNEEQNIIQQAKQQILQLRTNTANNEVQRLTEKCDSYFNTDSFVHELREDLPDGIPNLDMYLPDAIDTYRLALESKKKNMDEFFARKEESYQRFLSKKQKTTPLTSTLNEQQFKSSLVDVLKQYVMQATKKSVPLSTSATDSSATNRDVSSKPPHRRRNGKRGKRNGASETTNGTTSNGTSKNISTKQLSNSKTKSSSEQPRKQPPRKQQFEHNHHNSQQSINRDNNQKMSYASAVKGNKSRYVIIDDEDNIDEDGYKTVKNKHQKPSTKYHLSNRKNVSASDPRNVPKGKR
jgi:hypothetical protein